jgi:hypothetical protein
MLLQPAGGPGYYNYHSPREWAHNKAPAGTDWAVPFAEVVGHDGCSTKVTPAPKARLQPESVRHAHLGVGGQRDFSLEITQVLPAPSPVQVEFFAISATQVGHTGRPQLLLTPLHSSHPKTRGLLTPHSEGAGWLLTGNPTSFPFWPRSCVFPALPPSGLLVWGHNSSTVLAGGHTLEEQEKQPEGEREDHPGQ